MADIVLRSNTSTLSPAKVARIEPMSDSVTEERIAQIAFERIPEGLSVGEMTSYREDREQLNPGCCS